MKIQIIEDNSDLRGIYETLFSKAGYKVSVSADGAAGFKDVVEFKPDIILLDILMPEMDGYAFLNQLATINLKSVVIVCSNLSEREDVDRAHAAGAHFYLHKSDFVGDDLIQEVERLYKKRHSSSR